MAGYVLHLSEQENITLSAAVTRRLIDGGDGDAALLYLCLLKNRGSASPETLRAELKWDEARRSRAEAALARMGLVSAPKPEEPTPSPVPAPTAERPAYSREDVARKLEQDASFSALLREVERKLGPLSTPSVGKLLGLYEDLGLPADVLFLLVNHCIARHAAQYGAAAERLPAADYSLSCHLPDGSSAYTFCMCPGGEVFAAASEAGGVCTNGMSNSRRDGENANAAVLVTLRPEDFPDKSTLGGMYWQRSIEQRAFARGGGNYHAPAQLAGDFLAGRASTGPGRVQPTYRPGVTWCDLHDMLPARITDTLAQALPAFGRKLRGFDDPDAVLTAPETRSSSPVRIVRGEDRCSTGVPGLYPCGEGAGYAGGITSAAVDGLRCAESVLAALQNEA